MSRRRRFSSENRWPVGVAFSLPLIVGLCALTLFPVLSSFYFSLTEYPIFDPPRWIGIDNYKEMLAEPRFWQSVWNTTFYAMFAVPLGILVGLLLALLLNLKVKGMAFYRTMFFLPTIVPLIATCVLWAQILNPDHDLLNTALRFAHLPAPGWLADPLLSKPGLILMSIWGCGGGMVLYLAALQDVPMELYESASIDGARAWHRLWHITLPMISPILMFTGVMGLIGAAQYFSQAYVMTNGTGNPWDSTNFYALKLFNSAFTEYRLGYASAMAWLMFAVILSATLGVVKLSNRFVYYHS